MLFRFGASRCILTSFTLALMYGLLLCCSHGLRFYGKLGRVQPVSQAYYESEKLFFCGDLAGNFGRHGGVVSVAKRLNLKRVDTRKPIGYWDKFENFKKELQDFVTQKGTEGTMPTQNEFIAEGRRDLINAIAKHGGISSVAQKLKLKLSNPRKPASYWNSFT